MVLATDARTFARHPARPKALTASDQWTTRETVGGQRLPGTRIGGETDMPSQSAAAERRAFLVKLRSDKRTLGRRIACA